MANNITSYVNQSGLLHKAYYDKFGNLVRFCVKPSSKELTYESVIEALEKGDFYMSCGPEITSMYMEGTMLKVTCSDAIRVTVETRGRFARIAMAEDEPIREATFDLEKYLDLIKDDPDTFIFVTVTAADGTYAATRAYFRDELLNKA